MTIELITAATENSTSTSSGSITPDQLPVEVFDLAGAVMGSLAIILLVIVASACASVLVVSFFKRVGVVRK